MDEIAATSAPAWRRALSESIRSPTALLRALEIDSDLPQLHLAARRQFPLRVPRGFVARMRRGDPDDPLFRQVWPTASESVSTTGFSGDAVDELARRSGGGMIRKYRGRALIIATGACAINCRYCFRRHFPYGESTAPREWQATLAAIAADRSIEEVILSGGDPLVLDDTRLASLVTGLDAMPHVRRLRIHSRLPVVLPERIDAPLLRWIAHSAQPVIMVLHANHANELDATVAAACQRLRRAGAQLLNQSVLLAGINDSVGALAALSARLSELGVLPYYLHLMDRVQGAAHFEVDERKAAALIRALTASVSGYLVPKLVREVPGAPAKVGVPW